MLAAVGNLSYPVSASASIKAYGTLTVSAELQEGWGLHDWQVSGHLRQQLPHYMAQQFCCLQGLVAAVVIGAVLVACLISGVLMLMCGLACTSHQLAAFHWMCLLPCGCRQQNKVLLYSIIPQKVVSELAKGLGYARVRQATILFAVRLPVHCVSAASHCKAAQCPACPAGPGGVHSDLQRHDSHRGGFYGECPAAHASSLLLWTLVGSNPPKCVLTWHTGAAAVAR